MNKREFLYNETALTALRDLSDRMRQQLDSLMNTTTCQLLDDSSHEELRKIYRKVHSTVAAMVLSNFEYYKG
jgi:hypothetical protein